MGILKGLSSIVVAALLAATPAEEINVTKVDCDTNKQKTIEVEQVKSGEKETKEKKERLDVVSLPEINNSFKSFMDYRAITDTSSKQWELQEKAKTNKYGIRKIDKYYCIAVGTGIADVGKKLKITLEGNKIFYAIVADQKADIHTDETNKYKPTNNGGNILEFIVETEYLPNAVLQMGDVSYMPNDKFYGEILKIEVIQ